jgi:hypothetical protein
VYMESQQLPLIDHETWESLCCLCPQESQQATLIEYLQSLTPEWHNFFSSFYSESVVSVSARSSLTTGILKINADQYQYGAVLKVTIRDPWRYYTAMTRFVTIYMSEKLEVDAICKTSIEPLYAEEFLHCVQVKK